MQVALGRPAQAAFCVEEALTAMPSNAALHARLAEVSAARVRAVVMQCAGRLHRAPAVNDTPLTHPSPPSHLP
jgi:hypothetical protein